MALKLNWKNTQQQPQPARQVPFAGAAGNPRVVPSHIFQMEEGAGVAPVDIVTGTTFDTPVGTVDVDYSFGAPAYGLYDGTDHISRLALEISSSSGGVSCSDTDFMDPNGDSFGVYLQYRIVEGDSGATASIMRKGGDYATPAVGDVTFQLHYDETTHRIYLALAYNSTAAGSFTASAYVGGTVDDACHHWLYAKVNIVAQTVEVFGDTDAGTSTSLATMLDAILAEDETFSNNTDVVEIGSNADLAANDNPVQISYMAFLRGEASDLFTQDVGDTLWKHGKDQNIVDTGKTIVYTRTSRVGYPIAADKVAMWAGSAGGGDVQVPLEFNENWSGSDFLSLGCHPSTVNLAADANDLTAWTTSSAAVNEAELVSERGFREMDVVDATSNGGFVYHDFTGLTAATTYRVSWYARADTGTHAARVEVTQNDLSTTLASLEPTLTTTRSRNTFTFTTQGGQTQLRMKLFGGTAATQTNTGYHGLVLTEGTAYGPVIYNDINQDGTTETLAAQYQVLTVTGNELTSPDEGSIWASYIQSVQDTGAIRKIIDIHSDVDNEDRRFLEILAVGTQDSGTYNAAGASYQATTAHAALTADTEYNRSMKWRRKANLAAGAYTLEDDITAPSALTQTATGTANTEGTGGHVSIYIACDYNNAQQLSGLQTLHLYPNEVRSFNIVPAVPTATTVALATFTSDPGISSGITDHGVLTGLADDDHLQYLLIAGTRAMTGQLQAIEGTTGAPGYSFATQTASGMRYDTASSELRLVWQAQTVLAATSSYIHLNKNTRFLDGSVTAPVISAQSDTNTGVYWTGVADEMAVTTGGTQAVLWNASQQTLVADGSAALPSLSFAGDPDAGFWMDSAAGRVGVAVGGSPMAYFVTNQFRVGTAAENFNTPHIGSHAGTTTGLVWGGSGVPANLSIGTGGVEAIRWDATQQTLISGNTRITQPAINAAAPGKALEVLPGAHTDVPDSQDVIDVEVVARTVNFAGGGAGTNLVYGVRLQPVTMTADAAHTVSNAATLIINGPPVADTNVTATVAHALWVNDGTSRFDGVAYFANGASGAPGMAFTSDPDLGFYRSASNTMVATASSSHMLTLIPGATRHSIGDAMTPSIQSTTDTNTGLFWINPDIFGVTTGGTEAVRWNANQQTLAVDGSLANPAYSFVTDPDTGMNLVGSTSLQFVTGGAARLTLISDEARFGSSATPSAIRLSETATIPNPAVAGFGYLWVRNDTANVLIYTDDGGVDWVIGGSSAGAGTLDSSYDYGGAGAGRSINADSGSVRVYRENTVAGQTAGFELAAGTSADAGNVVRASPMILWSSQAWDTTLFNSDTHDFSIHVNDTSGDPTSARLRLAHRKNGSGFTTLHQWNDDGQQLAVDGSTTLPTYAFTSAPTTGMFLDTAGSGLRIVYNGSSKLKLEASVAVLGTSGVPTSIRFWESATIPGGAPTAANSTLWVRDDTASKLIYTDDANVDWILNAGSGTGGATTLDDAYDGGASGAGRIVTVDSDAVVLRLAGLAEATADATIRALTVDNNTAAVTGTQQYSPLFSLRGQGWDDTVTQATTTMRWGMQQRSVENVGALPTNELHFVELQGAGVYTSSVVFNGAGQLLASLGSSTVPSISFIGDENTGFYRVGEGQVALTCNTTEAFRVSSSGIRIRRDGTAGTPSLRWDDTVSGLYQDITNEIGLSTGGLEAVRWDASQNQTNQGTIYGPTSTGSSDLAYSFSDATLAGLGRFSASIVLYYNGSSRLVVNTGGTQIPRSGMAAGTTNGTWIDNATTATAGVPLQYSPVLRFQGRVWDTTTVSSKTSFWYLQNRLVSGATADLKSDLVFFHDFEGPQTEAFRLKHGGTAILWDGSSPTTGDRDSGVLNILGSAADSSLEALKLTNGTTPTTSAQVALTFQVNANNTTANNHNAAIIVDRHDTGLSGDTDLYIETRASGVRAEAIRWNQDQQTLVPDGAVGTPSYAFASDINTGIYLEPATRMSIAYNGVRQMYFNGSLVSITTGIELSVGTGTALIPAIRNNSDADTGFFFDTIGEAAVTTAGTEAIRWNAGGQTLVTDGSVALPAIARAAQPSTGLAFTASTIKFSTNGSERARFFNSGLAMNVDGLETLAAIHRLGDSDTGVFWPTGTNDVFAITTGGTEAARWDGSQNMSAYGDITATGDLDAAGGFRRTLQTNYLLLPAQSTTYTMKLDGSLAGNDDLGWFVAARNGSTVEISVWADAAVGAGQIDFWVQLSTDGGATFSDHWGTSGAPILSLDSSSNPSVNAAAQAKGTSTFSAGHVLRVRAVTNGTFSASRTIYCAVAIEC